MKYVVLCMLALISSLPAFAHDVREEFLGEVRLRNFGYSEPVEFRGACPSPQNRPVEAFQFRVFRKTADIERIEVTFGNGERENVLVRERFARDTSSRWYHLRGGVRCVHSFQVVGRGDGLPEHEHSVIQVWGLRHHRW